MFCLSKYLLSTVRMLLILFFIFILLYLIYKCQKYVVNSALKCSNLKSKRISYSQTPCIHCFLLHPCSAKHGQSQKNVKKIYLIKRKNKQIFDAKWWKVLCNCLISIDYALLESAHFSSLTNQTIFVMVVRSISWF